MDTHSKIRAIILTTLAAMPVFGADNDEEVFAFGTSCDYLQNLTTEQVIEIVQDKNREYWLEFCRVDGLENCAQYSQFLRGMGYLTIADDAPGVCQFNRYQYQEEDPMLYPNYGIFFRLENFGGYFPLENFGYRMPY